MPHLALVEKEHLSSFRRLAMGTWRNAKDPSVYGQIALRADKMMAYVEALRARSGRRVTLSHVMAKCVALVLAEMPDANAILRRGTIYLRRDIGVFFQVALEDPATGEIDLSGATLYGCHQRSIVEIVDEFEAKVGAVRARKDKALERSRSAFGAMPSWLVGWVLDAISLLTYGLNLDLTRLGLPRDPFGSVMITNVGSLGLEEAYVPLVPYSRVPLLLALGAVKDECLAVDGRVEIAPVLRVCATFDHRVLDGMHAAQMSRTIRRIFADPEGELGALPPEGARGPAA